MILFLILGLIIGGVSVIFVLQNITPITVTFFTWHIDGSLSVILLLALLSGMLISAFILLPSFIKVEWQVRKLKKANKRLEDDLMLARPVTTTVTEPAPVASEPTVDFDEESK